MGKTAAGKPHSVVSGGSAGCVAVCPGRLRRAAGLSRLLPASCHRPGLQPAPLVGCTQPWLPVVEFLWWPFGRVGPSAAAPLQRPCASSSRGARSVQGCRLQECTPVWGPQGLLIERQPQASVSPAPLQQGHASQHSQRQHATVQPCARSACTPPLVHERRQVCTGRLAGPACTGVHLVGSTQVKSSMAAVLPCALHDGQAGCQPGLLLPLADKMDCQSPAVSGWEHTCAWPRHAQTCRRSCASLMGLVPHGCCSVRA